MPQSNTKQNVNKKLHLILCWHMHQPDYREYLNGEFVLPWTYLHAMKDYTDMAFHLEQHPQARAVVNFVPILVEQLQDYERQFKSGDIRDALLGMLNHERLDELGDEARQHILDSCFKSNHTKMLKPYRAYQHLFDLQKLVEGHGRENVTYLSGQYLADLLVWYHLVWMGESMRRSSELVARLMTKGSQFTYTERKELFDLIGEIITGIVPRYRKLAERGQIEISSTPYNHPIVPLLLDFAAARESEPNAPLPQASHYPGGLSRVHSHLANAVESHRQNFGTVPYGMWPSEGGVSRAALKLLAEHGCEWTATGQAVLANSLRREMNDNPLPGSSGYLYKPYLVETGGKPIHCFFRDDGLSDKIGFEYAKWKGDDAAADFVHHLEEILRNAPGDDDPVVTVILDGENAWEYYPYNAYYFLSELYSRLESHADICTTTFHDCVRALNDPDSPVTASKLKQMVAGSWVYGTFSTWIGSADKNRGWDLLCEAKRSYDIVMSSGRLNADEMRLATEQLADCEGSDWFWWFGDYNSAMSVASFDALFRRNLSNLYRLLKLPPPLELQHVISVGTGEPAMGGAMRRSEAV
ncbi:glycoside hydrolase family 57 protein [Sideroxydans lithotrophicus]|uniref:Glycoside hydrolase family 57 n=1 Tax=Sideroxydans lithotrophicus (strain ES-1) TaxID=580332 RepID=D5CSV0_SIDLE|nr:glycoside hydrolase family 57 protein [Sideroxydans lithotrophicus]ADE12036.1 glycoside hydrolase family 57 [Sideroxydans lithotrophicus ES-1]